MWAVASAWKVKHISSIKEYYAYVSRMLEKNNFSASVKERAWKTGTTNVQINHELESCPNFWSELKLPFLQQLQKLKAENEKLKAENRALTRVVSKLTNSATSGMGSLATLSK